MERGFLKGGILKTWFSLDFCPIADPVSSGRLPGRALKIFKMESVHCSYHFSTVFLLFFQGLSEDVSVNKYFDDAMLIALAEHEEEQEDDEWVFQKSNKIYNFEDFCVFFLKKTCFFVSSNHFFCVFQMFSCFFVSSNHFNCVF